MKKLALVMTFAALVSVLAPAVDASCAQWRWCNDQCEAEFDWCEVVLCYDVNGNFCDLNCLGSLLNCYDGCDDDWGSCNLPGFVFKEVLGPVQVEIPLDT